MRRTRRRDAGYNMAEIALALFLLSLGLVSLVGLFPMGLDLQQRSQDRTCAVMISDMVTARIRALPEAGRFTSMGLTETGAGTGIYQGIFVAPETTGGQEVVSLMNNRYFVRATRTTSGGVHFWDIQVRRGFDNQGAEVTDGTLVGRFRTTSAQP